MRSLLPWTAPAVILCGALTLWTVTAQTPTGGAQPTDEQAAKETPRTYVVVTPDKIERFPAEFENQYIQVADFFDRRLDRFPAMLARYGITPATHFGFRTHRVIGSNMIAFAPRDNKEAQAFFDTPLVPETQIYLQGRVGPRIDAGDGFTTLFLVDRITRGHTPPPPLEEKKKPLVFKMEWDTPRGRQSQEYMIPEPGKKYEIPNPYDRTKKLYMTFQF